MDKVAHQSLRWDLEQDLSHLVQDEHLVRQVLDLVMRRVVQAWASRAGNAGFDFWLSGDGLPLQLQAVQPAAPKAAASA